MQLDFAMVALGFKKPSPEVVKGRQSQRAASFVDSIIQDGQVPYVKPELVTTKRNQIC